MLDDNFVGLKIVIDSKLIVAFSLSKQRCDI